MSRRQSESATHVFVEPVNRALPGQIGCGFVVALGRCIAIEAMNRVRIDIAFMRNVGCRQGLVVGRPRRPQSERVNQFETGV